MKFIISTGNSRKDTYWKESYVTWDEFTNKLAHTTITNETQEEYLKMKKHQQDDVKDVGGFVAGKLKDGRRKKEYVLSRSMLTLDIDHGDEAITIFENLEMLYGFTFCLYSTHKHTKAKPRLRLIIPLAKLVSPDEYQAISRKIATDIGIEIFDDSTYETNRLMYWPSTSIDGEFFFKNVEGNLLEPESILNQYQDWHDTSSWPVSQRQSTLLKRLTVKQADPLSKSGMVGAFCRSYGIEEAIDKFLQDIYEPSNVPGRYDYVPADSSAGVIIYDNKYAYSHHATDPAYGKLLNAFDLVRIHLYRDLDDGDDENSELKSYKTMLEYSSQDINVRKQLAKEREEEVRKDFNKVSGVESESVGTETHEANDDTTWQLALELNKNGTVKDTPTNILTIMRNDPRLKGIAYNEMTHYLDVTGTLPWNQIKPGWNDADLAQLKMYFDKYFGIWSPVKIKDALLSAATERAFHPIRDYLAALPAWDGIQRVDRLLIDYLGAEDNQYIRAVIRKTLVAAVARIYEPGVKYDYILVLNGPQGIGKSTFFAKLGGYWFSDSLTIGDMRDKSGAEKLQGYWILELGELAGLKKIDVETVESFITRTDDKFRQSYGINVENHPRQCVIVGSTNNTSGFLRDITGNRRFWPVRVNGGVKDVWSMTEIEQLWAEAIYLYKLGEKLFLTGDEERMAYEEQRDAMESDDREGLIQDFLETSLPENWETMDLFERRSFLTGHTEFGAKVPLGVVRRDRVCIHEIWCECLGKDKANLKRQDSYEIAAILMRIGGWVKYSGNKQGQTRFPLYGNQTTFCRIL
jgi:predicted P-loop ATPase